MLDWLQNVISGPRREPQKGERRRSVREERVSRPHVQATLPPVRNRELPPTFWQKSLPYKKGDRIGDRFNIYEVMGGGGFGVVYLVFDSEEHSLGVLKTFRDELLADGRARAALVEEAGRWVDLGEHPHILSAGSVLEIFRRLYVRMEYIVPDDEGRTCLAHYLRGRTRHAIPYERQLEWGVQFCLGMEHANGRGIASHGDIKPENIMIRPDGTLKITDFGMAKVLEKSAQARRGAVPIPNGRGQRRIGLSVIQLDGHTVCGTPGYMAPEIYRGEAADVRSDIYSFGVVLWQMATHSAESPFWKESPEGDTAFLFRTVQAAQLVESPGPVEGPLQVVIAKCMHRERTERYQNFEELGADLEELLWEESGRVETPREAAVENLRGHGLSADSRGRDHESVAAAERAVHEVGLLNGMSNFHRLGRQKECVQCCDQALAADPKNIIVLCNKGVALRALKKTTEALACLDECLTLAPAHHPAWYHKSLCLTDQGRDVAALEACNRAVQLEQRHARSWELKGALLLKQNKAEQSVVCFDEALKHDPHSAEAWFNKARALAKLRHPTDAMLCFDAVLAKTPDSSAAWLEKGRLLMVLKKYPRAIECFDKALAVVPTLASAWFNKGLAEEKLLNYKSTVNCFTKFLELAGPEHERAVPVVKAHLQWLRVRR